MTAMFDVAGAVPLGGFISIALPSADDWSMASVPTVSFTSPSASINAIASWGAGVLNISVSDASIPEDSSVVLHIEDVTAPLAQLLFGVAALQEAGARGAGPNPTKKITFFTNMGRTLPHQKIFL